MDFDKPKVYGDTFISDGLVLHRYVCGVCDKYQVCVDAQVGGEGGREEWGLVNTLTRLVNTLNTW